MSELQQAIHDLPLASLIPVGLLLAVGLLLWAAGRKVLRAGFAIAGLVIGAGLGWILPSATGLNVDPWIPAFVLGVIVACVAALTHRLAVAGALAVVIGVAAPMAVSVVDEVMQGEHQPDAEMAPSDGEAAENAGEAERDEPNGPDEYDLFFGTDDPSSGGIMERPEFADDPMEEDAGDSADGDWRSDLQDAAVDEAARDAAERVGIEDEQLDAVKEHAKRILSGIKEWWMSQPDRLRPALISAGIAGFILGILVGTVAPMASASAVTAFGGSLLWLSSARVMAVSLGLGGGWLPQSATVNLIIWIIVAIIGIGIQWTLRRKQADESS